MRVRALLIGLTVVAWGCGAPQVPASELDTDGDGMHDDVDRCPEEAEDVDQFEDDDGCPDTDNDGDGHHDGYDSCPDEAEDEDGDHDEDGCPDEDTDGDGIDDRLDRCHEEAEDVDEVADDDGCPEEDGDGDGVADTEDECDTEPETLDGIHDNDGCPEENPIVIVRGSRIFVQVPFAWSRHHRPEGRETRHAIEAIERLIDSGRLPPAFSHIRVEVRAENEGRADQRAHALARMLHRALGGRVEHAGAAGEDAIVFHGIAEAPSEDAGEDEAAE